MSYQLVDADLEEKLLDPEERLQWLLLDEHTDFKGHWRVNSFGKQFKYDFDDLLGPYRVIAPSDLKEFQERASEFEYKIAFFEDPVRILDSYQHLNDLPEVVLNSDLEGTTNGMLPWQVQGFNYLKDLDAGVARWDTGCGKTALASALVAHNKMADQFDLCLFVVKKNNKVNTARKLRALAGVQSIVIHGNRSTRRKRYAEIADRLAAGERGLVLIVNYEQFKHDFVQFEVRTDRANRQYAIPSLTEWGEAFFPNRDLLCIWDEMPMKLKNRTTRLYMAVCHCLYNTTAPQVVWDRKRPRWLRQYMLSATPIVNDPEDWFNCVRILDPRIYGTVADFRTEFVARYSYWDDNKPEAWHKLDKMSLMAAHIVHQVDKTDPDIAKHFPKVLTEALYIDWDGAQGKLYQELQTLARKLAQDEEEKNLHVFSLINLCQMLCDAPEMILDSAAHREAYEGALALWEELGEDWATAPDPEGSEAALIFVRSQPEHTFTNADHTKLETLRELLTETHADEKVCLFSKWNNALMPTLEMMLTFWEVPYVRYTGTEKQQQAAQDAFQNDPSVRVFLSSDAGSDSIDLDAASVVIHYDLPWTWTTYIQRQNRAHRPTSKHATIRYYTLLMADSIEDRILEIVLRKQDYHDGLFKPIAGTSASARMTKADLLYILTGA